MLSVIVKAFNEEKNIARCIESILRETDGLEREIIVVDSLSTDQTVAISKQYPVKVVQFINQDDCGCGAAPQLGYQISKGSLIYIIDGDMEMIPGFLKSAISYLSERPVIAGVGGVLVDRRTNTVFEKRRSEHYQKVKGVVEVSSLGGGGLYRRAAIKDIGYFSHKGLKALEEMELGLRLVASGWRLVRLPIPSIIHSGHNESYLKSMIRIWRNGMLAANGAFLRSAWGKRWFIKAVLLNWFAVAPLGLIGMAALVYGFVNKYLFLSMTIGSSFFIVVSLVVLALSIKKRSLKLSLLSVSSWFIVAAASVSGLIHPVSEPNEAITYRIV